MRHTGSPRPPCHRLLLRRLLTGSRITTALVVGLALLPTMGLQAQQCEETAQSQILDALDRTTNRILLKEVVDDYGDEAKGILVQIAGDQNQTPKRRGH